MNANSHVYRRKKSRRHMPMSWEEFNQVLARSDEVRKHGRRMSIHRTRLQLVFPKQWFHYQVMSLKCSFGLRYLYKMLHSVRQSLERGG